MGRARKECSGLMIAHAKSLREEELVIPERLGKKLT